MDGLPPTRWRRTAARTAPIGTWREYFASSRSAFVWHTARVRTALLLVAGLLLTAGGGAVALDWRAAARKYTDFISNMTPTRPSGDPRKQERQLFNQSRVIGAVVALFGLALILAALS